MARQHRVFGHGDDIVQAGFGVENVEDLRRGKAAVEANEEPRLRKRDPQQVNQAPQQPARPARGRRIARPQHRRAQVLLGFVVEGEKRQQRQITPTVVVSVEERELLRAMGRVIGRIEINRDLPSPAMEPPLMPLDHVGGEVASHRIEVLRFDTVFEARDRGLRGE